MNFKEIISFEAACKALNKNPESLPDYSKAEMSEGEQKFNMAAFKLARIGSAINRNDDGTEWHPKPGAERHYPWMWLEEGPSGPGLSLVVVDYVISLAFVASRLCCRDRARAKFMFEKHKDLFEDMIIFHP